MIASLPTAFPVLQAILKETQPTAASPVVIRIASSARIVIPVTANFVWIPLGLWIINAWVLVVMVSFKRDRDVMMVTLC